MRGGLPLRLHRSRFLAHLRPRALSRQSVRLASSLFASQLAHTHLLPPPALPCLTADSPFWLVDEGGDSAVFRSVATGRLGTASSWQLPADADATVGHLALLYTGTSTP